MRKGFETYTWRREFLNILLNYKGTKKWRETYLCDKWLTVNEDLAIKRTADFWLLKRLI